MKILSIYTLVTIQLLISQTNYAQNHDMVGGGCDGCELMFVGMPENISSTSYSPAWNDQGQKLLITGKVLQNNGITPASDVIVYYWQTDNNGNYTSKKSQHPEAMKHGYIRGWVKSDATGNYKIYSIKPKAYPNRNTPAHIHLSIKEPKISDEYYVDNLVFDYDPLLTTAHRKKLENRGGSGVLRTLISDEMLIAEHNVVLGLNIPNYPITNQPIHSGQEIGEDFNSITPYHAWGPDIGTTTCPVCRYGRNLGIMYFVNKNIKSQDVKDWLIELEAQSQRREKYLKVYLVYGNGENHSPQNLKNILANIGRELDLKKVALTFVPSFNDSQSGINLTKINPQAQNTFIIYKNRNIIGKFINLYAGQKNFTNLNKFIDDNYSQYFNLPIDTTSLSENRNCCEKHTI